MPRSLVPLLTLFASIAIAAASAACTTTSVVETPVSASLVPGSTTNPFDGLAPDWRSKAAGYLNEHAAKWLSSPPPVGNIKCALSCHTTFPFFLARPALGIAADASTVDHARTRINARLVERAQGTAIPMYGKNPDTKSKESHATEAVLNATALVFADLGASGALSPEAKAAFDGMWKEQRADGAWDWLEFELEPWETRNDWGTVMAALVSGSVPEGTSVMQAAGTAKLVGYLKGHLATMALHDRIAVLWASSKLKTLLDPTEQTAIANEILAKQLKDGGFSLGSWGKGALAEAGANTSDGYATALAALALCTGIPDGRQRPDVIKALSWIARNQQPNGSWPGRSVNSDSARSHTYMTDAATAYAVIAMTTCVSEAK